MEKKLNSIGDVISCLENMWIKSKDKNERTAINYALMSIEFVLKMKKKQDSKYQFKIPQNPKKWIQ
jgi:hypothetical protein